MRYVEIVGVKGSEDYGNANQRVFEPQSQVEIDIPNMKRTNDFFLSCLLVVPSLPPPKGQNQVKSFGVSIQSSHFSPKGPNSRLDKIIPS